MVAAAVELAALEPPEHNLRALERQAKEAMVAVLLMMGLTQPLEQAVVVAAKTLQVKTQAAAQEAMAETV
jgi:hypothetical protein